MTTKEKARIVGLRQANYIIALYIVEHGAMIMDELKKTSGQDDYSQEYKDLIIKRDLLHKLSADIENLIDGTDEYRMDLLGTIDQINSDRRD